MDGTGAREAPAPLPIPQTDIYHIIDDAPKTLPFFALVIGINEYETVNPLTGATADADEVDLFLQSHLRVPKDHIINLRDRDATRQGIIQAFRDLQSNPDINFGDAIFIYFAGHGSEADAPAGWATPGSKVQVLLPQDVGLPCPKHATVPPILDRTIAGLLDDLAHHKGNNITVVFDCCHSSSGTRSDENVPDRVARTVPYEGVLPNDLDSDIISHGRAITVPTGFLQRNLRSHILLAACGSDELAYENRRLGRGAFTMAFVQTLVRNGVDKLTYTGFMERLPTLPKQNPQCEGYHNKRVLFDAKIPGAHRFFIGVEKYGDNYVLKAGTAQGIAVDSEFTIHAAHILDPELNPALCTMRAKEAGPFRTTLEKLNNDDSAVIPIPAYAQEVRSGSGHELRVHFTDALKDVVNVDEIRQASIHAGEPDFGFMVEEREQAEFIVDISHDDSKHAVFLTTGTLTKEQGYERLPQDVGLNANAISTVLRAAARWNFHFKRTNTAPFSGSVNMEFYRLERDGDTFGEDGGQVLTPAGSNLNRIGLVDIVVKEDEFFGVKITNSSGIDLYPYLFYFDISDLSIEDYYLAPTGRGRVDPPLRARSYLPVGYGAGGGVPFAFHLRDGENIDVGFLKLFLTTSPTDFQSLKQPTPFELDRELDADDTPRAPLPKTDVIQKLKEKEQNREEWGTVMTVMVQRSKPRPNSEPAKFTHVSAISPKPSQSWFTRFKLHISKLSKFICCS